jgi:hypothetical protein
MAGFLNIGPDVTLVMTSSIDVNGMTSSSRPDPFLREQDYLGTLTYYLTRHPDVRRIVFIENSGWPLDRLKQAVSRCNPHGKEVELISLNCNQFPRTLGKSYGEMLLLDEGLSRSQLAAKAPYIAKITGRIYVDNLTQVLKSVRKPFEFMVDLRDHGLYEMLRLPASGRYGDSRLFVVSLRFYNEVLRGKYTQLDEGNQKFIETLLYNVAKDPCYASRTIRRFPVEAFYRGLAGHLNKQYDSPREHLKRSLRGSLRRLAPWLHV